ncbi:hypothetical protein Salmi_Mp015 (mitochondrion) [Salvia miltiorrhiza]|uniref:Uncharacterized protein n=1 Tax=Salvia miltiorrhiza TaxID=226208 RepID=V9P562_SALMI|nr:hypothetical protein Salmi_Mp015 [Salvia miltiorrhiza]AGU16549.1 hypothetical protein Salmi_Mp015 [Salvia miltiorrhiza]
MRGESARSRLSLHVTVPSEELFPQSFSRGIPIGRGERYTERKELLSGIREGSKEKRKTVSDSGTHEQAGRNSYALAKGTGPIDQFILRLGNSSYRALLRLRLVGCE